MSPALSAHRDRPRSQRVDPSAAAMAFGDRPPIASGDEIESAFLKQAPVLFRYLYARTGREQDAEDLLGDTFVQAWRYRGRIANPEGWLFTVARHCANRFLSRRSHETTIEEVEGSGVIEFPEPRRRTVNPTGPEMIAFFALSDTDREILVLHGLGERSMAEIALILDVPEAAAWQRWQRARTRYFNHLVAVGLHPPEGWRRPRRPAAGRTAAREADADRAIEEGADHDVP